MDNTQFGPPLPDTSLWQPRKDTATNLTSAFLKRCQAVEERIQTRIHQERQMNIDNFDSGAGVEEIIREELRNILPTRYSVRAGVVNDHNGFTAGDCDVILHNQLWVPLIKAGATTDSRRVHLPIEGIYSIGEVKQTVDFRVLDEAMEKLVICHRLQRPSTYAYRVAENREGSPCSHGLTNPLYSFIIATNVKSDVNLDKLVDRFFYINSQLKRHEVVRALCVLGHGVVTWGYKDKRKMEIKPASFMLEDLYEPLIPVYQDATQNEPALYFFLVDLLQHLFHSVLAPEDIGPMYGVLRPNPKIPTSPEITLKPDPERLASLSIPCSNKHETISANDQNIDVYNW